MHDLVIAGVIVVAVAAVVVKRFIGEPLNARDLFVPPVVLFGIGVYSISKAGSIAAVDLTWIVITTAVGIAIGVARGSTIRVFTRDGVLWQRYTRWTLAVWVLAIGIKFGVTALATAMGMHAEMNPMTLSIGAGLVGEMLPVGLRALRTGAPFAPERPGASEWIIGNRQRGGGPPA